MKDRLLVTFCLTLGLALAACTPPTSEWSETQAPKKLHVDYVRFEHSAAFVPGSAEFAEGEVAELTAFLEKSEVTGDDHVYVEPPSDDGLTAQRIGKLAHELTGRRVGAVTLAASPKDVPSDHLRLIVERYVVTPPNCPDWTKPSYGAGHSNDMPSNWGCADATNLGLMIADPRDLVIGRTLGPAEGDPAIAAITRYRSCKTKSPTPVTSSTIYSALAQGGGDSDCDKRALQ